MVLGHGSAADMDARPGGMRSIIQILIFSDEVTLGPCDVLWARVSSTETATRPVEMRSKIQILMFMWSAYFGAM